MIPVPANTKVWSATGVTDVLGRIADHNITRFDEMMF